MGKYQRVLDMIDVVERSNRPFLFNSAGHCVIGLAVKENFFGNGDEYRTEEIMCRLGIDHDQFQDIWSGWNRIHPSQLGNKAYCLSYCRQCVQRWEREDAKFARNGIRRGSITFALPAPAYEEVRVSAPRLEYVIIDDLEEVC